MAKKCEWNVEENGRKRGCKKPATHKMMYVKSGRFYGYACGTHARIASKARVLKGIKI